MSRALKDDLGALRRRKGALDRLAQEPRESDEWWEGFCCGMLNVELSRQPDQHFAPLFPVSGLDHARKLAERFGYDLHGSDGKPLAADLADTADAVGIYASINLDGRGQRLIVHMSRLGDDQFQAWLLGVRGIDHQALWHKANKIARGFYPRAVATLAIGAERWGRTYAAATFLRATHSRHRRIAAGVPRVWEREMRHGGTAKATS